MLSKKELLHRLNFEALNPMQESLESEFKKEKDVLLLSPTGSGKTIAFLWPILQKIKIDIIQPQVLIIVPTRELTLQIESVFKSIKTPHKIVSLYGGVRVRHDLNALQNPPVVIVGTPGRILDHLGKDSFAINHIKTLVFDEYDKGLEMGFQEDMERIYQRFNQNLQLVFTSATKAISIPDFIQTNQLSTLNFLDEKTYQPNLEVGIYKCIEEDHFEDVFHLVTDFGAERHIVFCNHIDAVERLAEALEKKGIKVLIFHGQLSQEEREDVLIQFKSETAYTLVSTDLAARGLDIPNISFIIHYQIPNKEDAFVHRNGRTARMQANGKVILIQNPKISFPDYITEKKYTNYSLEQNLNEVVSPKFQLLKLNKGKKDKINKGDILGFLCKKIGLQNSQIGQITIKPNRSFVAIERTEIKSVIHNAKDKKIKNKTVKWIKI